jgi:hypothetical protein
MARSISDVGRGNVCRWVLLASSSIVWGSGSAAAVALEDVPEAESPVGETSRPAAAAPAAPEVSRVECFTRHEEAQVARRQGRLLDARSGLRICSRASCPSAIRGDCVDWLDQVGRSLPSVVVTARARGADIANVSVLVDGKLVTDRLTGSAIEVDPGVHRFRFETPSWPAVERTVLVSEGVKDRPIDVEFAPPLPAAATAMPAQGPRQPRLQPPNRFDYVVGGVGAASLATSAFFGGWGLWLDYRYKDGDGCAPFCSEEEKSSVSNKLLVADVALGLTVVSLVVLYLHLARSGPTDPPGASARPGVSLLLDATSAQAGLGLRGWF